MGRAAHGAGARLRVPFHLPADCVPSNRRRHRLWRLPLLAVKHWRSRPLLFRLWPPLVPRQRAPNFSLCASCAGTFRLFCVCSFFFFFLVGVFSKKKKKKKKKK